MVLGGGKFKFFLMRSGFIVQIFSGVGSARALIKVVLLYNLRKGKYFFVG